MLVLLVHEILITYKKPNKHWTSAWLIWRHKDAKTINDLRKQVAKLQSEKDANDAAAQQRISFLEGQGKKDTEEIAYLKRQVRIPNTQFNSFVLWYPCVNETLNMCVSCCVTSS